MNSISRCSQEEPEYRVERIAKEHEIWQWLVNGVRRIIGLPISVTADEAAESARKAMGEPQIFDNEQYSIKTTIPGLPFALVVDENHQRHRIRKS